MGSPSKVIKYYFNNLFDYFTYCYYSATDWATREAYIRLYERESQGLPAVDKNFIDPAKIELPDDKDVDIRDIVV